MVGLAGGERVGNHRLLVLPVDMRDHRNRDQRSALVEDIAIVVESDPVHEILVRGPLGRRIQLATNERLLLGGKRLATKRGETQDRAKSVASVNYDARLGERAFHAVEVKRHKSSPSFQGR